MTSYEVIVLRHIVLCYINAYYIMMSYETLILHYAVYGYFIVYYIMVIILYYSTLYHIKLYYTLS